MAKALRAAPSTPSGTLMVLTVISLQATHAGTCRR
jgi:hypothetical protein